MICPNIEMTENENCAENLSENNSEQTIFINAEILQEINLEHDTQEKTSDTQLATISSERGIISVDFPTPEKLFVVNKIAARGAEHTKNKMAHKKDRHEKGKKQRNRQKIAAEKRLIEKNFAFSGKVHISTKPEDDS